MTAPKQYRTPQALFTALAARQKERASKQNVPVGRLAQIDLYFRFLDRVVRELGGAIVVKGGLALEMRLQRARTTLDVDVRASGDPDKIYERIRVAGLRDHQDFLSFDVTKWQDEIEDTIYRGRRFKVQAMLAGRKYLNQFGLDVVFGDAMLGPPDTIMAPDAFSFAGISSPEIPIYPLSSHLAEKLHAYTLPRDRENSRLKDLLDIALIAQESELKPSPVIESAMLAEAVTQTFAARKTHDVPGALPPFPQSWAARYPQLRAENNLPWASLDEVYAAAVKFIDPVLSGVAHGSWDATQSSWSVNLAPPDR